MSTSCIPFISVIIPVYNVEEYICECLDSILCQDFDDFEIILINDGSTDNSLSICTDYANHNSKIKVFTQNNQGVSQARNLGISKSLGQYVWFIDPDDRIHRNAFNILNEFLVQKDPDIILFNFFVINTHSMYEHQLNRIYRQKKQLSTLETYQSILWGSGFQGFVWNKIYRREIISDIRFNNNIHYLEDAIFNADVVKNSKKIFSLPISLNYYRQRENSAVNTFNKKQLSYLKALDILNEKMPVEFSNDIQNKKQLALIKFSAQCIIKDSQLYSQLKNQFKKNISSDYKSSSLKKFERKILFIGNYNFLLATLLFYTKEKVVRNDIYYKIKNLQK